MSTPATRSPALSAEVEHFLRPRLDTTGGTGLIVAYSGGPDSTALLVALAELRDKFDLALTAAHLDHALDSSSAERARLARCNADALGIDFVTERATTLAAELPGRSLEEVAREARYDFLERSRQRRGARWIALGHHRDDQRETVLLRLMFGSGLAGLGAMRSQSGHLLRPLLEVSRARVAAAAAASGLEVASDPGNFDLARPRNLVRRHLLPSLTAAGFDPRRLESTADAARRACGVIDKRLAALVRPESTDGGAELDLDEYRRLPEPLRPFALRLLHLTAGAGRAPRRGAVDDLERQLAAGGGVGCDCSEGWRWSSRRNQLALARVPDEVGAFSYRLRLPGELPIPELDATLRIRQREQEAWMFEGSRERAAMSLPLAAGQTVQIRNRRPGDRVRPFGCAHERKLKDILIDCGVPRSERSSLPLVVVDERIAWVPGVTIDERFRIRPRDRPWVAELVPTRHSHSSTGAPKSAQRPTS